MAGKQASNHTGTHALIFVNNLGYYTQWSYSSVANKKNAFCWLVSVCILESSWIVYWQYIIYRMLTMVYWQSITLATKGLGTCLQYIFPTNI